MEAGVANHVWSVAEIVGLLGVKRVDSKLVVVRRFPAMIHAELAKSALEAAMYLLTRQLVVLTSDDVAETRLAASVRT